MKEINIESLIEYGFYVTQKREYDGSIFLSLPIQSWSIEYEKWYNYTKQDYDIKLYLQADGGYDYSGEFDLSHFKYIEQIAALIKAMDGGIKTY